MFSQSSFFLIKFHGFKNKTQQKTAKAITTTHKDPATFENPSHRFRPTRDTSAGGVVKKGDAPNKSPPIPRPMSARKNCKRIG